MEKQIKLIEALLLLNNGMNQFDVMTKLDLNVKDIIFIKKIDEELNNYLKIVTK